MICRVFGHRWKVMARNRWCMDIEYQCERCSRQKHWSGYWRDAKAVFREGPLPKTLPLLTAQPASHGRQGWLMPENIEYSMTTEDAACLAGIAQHPLAQRREKLQQILAADGPGRLVEMLAQFIGMANSVAENCKEMSDQVLIDECGVHPDKFDSVNLPTITGACQGVLLASKCDPSGACYGCAYRLGSIANQSPIATSDAEFVAHDQKGFMCHAHTDDHGEPTKVCLGHAKAAKAAA